MAKSKPNAEKNAPSCADTADKRRALGMLLQMIVRAGLDQKGDSEVWWATCEKNHRNVWSNDSAPGTGMTPMHIPYTQPRVDMLSAQVCTVIGKQNPYMLSEGLGSDEAEDKAEKIVHKFWKAAGFEKRLREASNICVDTNKVWYRLAWEMNPAKAFGGILLDVIRPQDVCIFPATLNGILGARLVGHRFYKRQAEVLESQRTGVYFNDQSPTMGDSPEEYDTSQEIVQSGASPSVSGPDPRDQKTELWDVTVKYQDPDKPEDGEQLYRATFAFKQGLLLSFERYPYSRPWYFDAGYLTGNDQAYWSAVSVSRHLSGLEDTNDKASAGVYNCEMMSAYPNMYGPELPTKDTRISWGEMVQTDRASEMFSPSLNVRTQGLSKIIEDLEEVGDRTARISQNTQGGTQQAQTATENSIIAAGVATGVEEYIANFSEPLPDMADFTLELLRLHWSEWEAMYAKLFEVQEADLKGPFLWETNGQSPGNTPGAKIAAANQLIEILKAAPPPGSPPSVTGLDWWDTTNVIVSNMNFSGADGLQIDKEQLQAQLQEFQQQAQQQQQQGLMQQIQPALQELQQQGQMIGQLQQQLASITQALGGGSVAPVGPVQPPGLQVPPGMG